MVDDTEYELYWNAKRCGDTSETFIIVCRRLLGIGPNGRKITISALNFVGGVQALKALSKSPLVNYIEKEQVFLDAGGAFDIINLEHNINAHDEEFEPDLEL